MSRLVIPILLMIMNRRVVLGIVAVLFASSASGQNSKRPAAPISLKSDKETRYLAFQIFTYGPNPKVATMGEGMNPQIARFPEEATLRDTIEDIKRRIGTVGDQQTRLAVMLGHLSFDHGDAEITKFIELGFELALETDVAVGFHIDDSMFWAKRKDLWSDPNNVEALDWDGTPCTGRSLEWQTGPGAKADAAPPQMCFNSKVIEREVHQRAALLGKAIQAGVNRLQQRNRPELFAGVIAGSETMIGQDFKTGKYLGYRALLNRGFSREHPPRDLDLERENIVQEFIDHWTEGLAEAGVSPQKIYSHTAFFPRRAFKIGGNKETTYSQHNNFAPPSVAFGKHHRPGFSTYPAPGRFDDIYEELAKHKQVGWASCEGTNLQLGSGPGQSGMNMETYLAKMFNHGGTLVNIFSWGIGGEANKNMSFRVVTEGEEALRAYRKFLKGDPLIEAKTEALTLLERLPPKIHKIQKELPAWIQKAGNNEKAAAAAALMQELQEQLKAKNFEEVEKTADSILKMMGSSAPAAAQGGDSKPQQTLLEQLKPDGKSTRSPTAPTQAGKGTTPSNRSPGPTASPGRMRLTEPAPLDFNDHEGYLSLFDGVSLKDWDGNPKFWRVENGAIIGESTKQNPSGNQYLVYRGFEAKDFTLKFEIKVDGNGGTGFQYRSKTGIPWLSPISPVVTANVGPVNLNWMMTGPQADFWPSEIYTGQFYSENTPMRIIAWRGQIVESYGLAKKRLMGNLGDRKALGERVKKDDWNQCTVIARGGTCIHVVNGHVMAVLIDDDPASSNNQSGLFGIEIEVITKLYVKNIWVKKLN